MSEAPFCHDGSATGDDACHAACGVWDEAEEDGGVDGEVVYALLCLLDEGVTVEFPGEFFYVAVYFF